MKLGFTTYQLPQNLNFDESIRLAKDTGCAGMDFRTGNVYKHGVEVSLTGEERAKMRRQLEDNYLELASINSEFSFDAEDEQERRKSIEGAKQSCVLAHDFGSTLVRLFGNLIRTPDAHDTVKYVAGLNFRSILRGLRLRATNRKTFYIQIHEGCSMGCTYCAIQKAIGPLRNSKPVDEVISEFREGLEKGYGHFRLIGDCAGSYGRDIGTNLGELLGRISEIGEPFTLELTDINPVFLKVIFEPVKTLCRQKRLSNLYIPIQSGNDRVLGLMHRRYDVAETRRMLLELKEAAPKDFRIGTSVIVGFPSESEEEMRDTADFCNDMAFDWIFCHGFSPRPGTPAADLPDQLSEEEVTARVEEFREMINDKNSVVLDFK